MFRFDGKTWTEEAKLVAHDGDENDLFGWSLTLGESTIVVTAFFDDDGNRLSGDGCSST